MTLTPSNMLPLNTVAAPFTLLDVISEQPKKLSELKSERATVIMFICNHCPYVKHVQPELIKLAKEYQPKGIAFIAINSNDVDAYPEDSPVKMKETAKRLNYPFPYLFDKTQEVAKLYEAACTPDFFVYDKNLRLVYRGQLDDSRPGNDIGLTGRDLRKALDNLLQGIPVDQHQKPSIGCNIKWKS